MILLKILGIVMLLILGMVVTFLAFITLLAYVGEKFAGDAEKDDATREIEEWRDGK